MQCFYLNLDPYLAQWFAHMCGASPDNPFAVPLKLRKGSPEACIVRCFSRKKSEADVPDLPTANSVAIQIPEFKGKPSDIYSFVPRVAKVLIVQAIREQFDLALFNDIVSDLFPPGLKRELIDAWLEKYGIVNDEVNWLAVEKRYSRLRARLLERNNYSRKKSV
ncbi:MAG: hypothetical protein HDT02_03570 [Bacteroidales bacterium]|nr:hypothetical protein [Bacteroidales bacterium]